MSSLLPSGQEPRGERGEGAREASVLPAMEVSELEGGSPLDEEKEKHMLLLSDNLTPARGAALSPPDARTKKAKEGRSQRSRTIPTFNNAWLETTYCKNRRTKPPPQKMARIIGFCLIILLHVNSSRPPAARLIFFLYQSRGKSNCLQLQLSTCK